MADIYFRQSSIDRQVYICNTKLTSDYFKWGSAQAISSGYNVNIELTDDKFVFPTNAYKLFYGAINANWSDFKLDKWDTSQCTNMNELFYSCPNLTSVDLSGVDFSNVTTAEMMFYNCKNLTSINMRNAKVDSLVSASRMFDGCHKLVSIDVSGWNVQKLENMSMMFRATAVSTIDLSSWNATNITNLESTFDQCSNLTSLDISGLRTSKVTTMAGMFGSCASLTSIDLSNITLDSCTTLYRMFRDCTSLTELDLRTFNVENSPVINVDYMFNNCTNLESIYALPDTDWSRKSDIQGSGGLQMFEGTPLVRYSEVSIAAANNIYTKVYHYFKVAPPIWYKYNIYLKDSEGWNEQNIYLKNNTWELQNIEFKTY